MSADCLFCKIILGEIPSAKVYEDERVFAFRDINPQAPTHILVVPKVHVSGLSECADRPELLGQVQAAAARLAAREQLGDYRCVINCGPGAGQTVFHLHLHLLAGRTFAWPPG